MNDPIEVPPSDRARDRKRSISIQKRANIDDEEL